jgi:transglutaminase-like putative cysteine protease
MASPLDLRKGAHVQYRSPVADMWQEGVLVRGSSTGEEWLVKNRFGEYWVPVTRLRPALEPQPGH